MSSCFYTVLIGRHDKCISQSMKLLFVAFRIILLCLCCMHEQRWWSNDDDSNNSRHNHVVGSECVCHQPWCRSWGRVRTC